MLLNKVYYTFKFLVPRRLQIQLRRYYVNRKRLQHADVWPIDPNAAKPREYGGKTGASEKEGQLPIFKGKIGSCPPFRGSCTGFSGQQDGKEKSGAVPPFSFLDIRLRFVKTIVSKNRQVTLETSDITKAS